MSKRKFFSLGEKVKIVNYAEKNPHLSSRKLAEEYCCGSTCIQTLIKQKDVILTDWKCHENSFFQKKERSKEFQDVTNGISSNTFFKSYESRRLTECIKIECYRIFTASNGWLGK